MSCQDCDECLEVTGVACYSILDIVAGLDADTSYTVFLKDRHGNYFTQDITTDSAGDFQLDLTAFDDGMFNQYSGAYQLEVSQNALWPENPEVLTIGYEEYACLVIKFQNIA